MRLLRNIAPVLIYVLFFFVAAPLAAEDWPEFRGPGAQGHSTTKNLPSEWGEGKNVVWKQAVPGKGWSSPSLSHGRIYLTSAVLKDSSTDDISLDALCFDATSGKKVWQTTIFEQDAAAPKIHSKNSHASPTPIVAGNRIYVHFGHQGCACLQADGTILWKNREITYEPVHGNGGSPVLAGNFLIYSCDGASNPFVIALHAATGKEAWRFNRPAVKGNKFAFCTPLVIEAAGKQQLIIPGAGIINSLDPQTGQEYWRAEHGGYSTIPRPIFGHGLVYFSSGYNSPVVMAIRPDGSGDVTETHVAWEAKKGAPHTPSLLLVGDELYLVSDKGVLTCLDAKTGDEHWSERIGGNYSASPLYADGKIYIQAEDGSGIVIKPGRTFEKLGDTGFEERTLASYAVGDGAIFVRTADNLYRIQNRAP